MELHEARALFPGLKGRVFLDSGAVGLMPDPAIRAVHELVRLAAEMQGPDTESVYGEMVRRRARAASAVARLIGASPDEVALTESTTHGLNLAAAALSLRRGDGVIVPDTEFPQVAIPWVKLAEERGLRLKFLKNRDGVFGPEDVEAAMDRRTRVVCLSSVQWSNGFRADLGAIGRLCRSRNAFLVVDAIQHVGACPIDTRTTPVDF
ncbi:MAG: aminotransferase class V-fold PLP-dependent enzyme, partial [Acidobacteriota bacterium]